jgi:hypothetical protein
LKNRQLPHPEPTIHVPQLVVTRRQRRTAPDHGISLTWLLGLVMFAFGLLVLLIAFRLRSSNIAIRKAAEKLASRGM